MGVSQLQQLSTTMDMDIQVAIADRQPGGTAKLLLVRSPCSAHSVVHQNLHGENNFPQLFFADGNFLVTCTPCWPVHTSADRLKT